MLKMGLNKTFEGNSCRYTFWPNLPSTLKGPAFYEGSLVNVPSGNLSGLICMSTKAPGWNSTCRRCTSAYCLYVALLWVMQFRTLLWTSCKCLQKSSAPSLTLGGKGNGVRSSGALGLVIVTISKGERPMLRLTELLWANSTWGRTRS